MKYEPRKAFIPFHMRDKRWACIVAHRRAGKTVACVAELLTRALATKKNNARFAYIAPYYSQAKQIAWDYLKQYGFEVITKITESELQVELMNGSRIRLYGADNPDALRGIYLDGVILDEFADMRPSVWPEIIRPTLADRKGWAVFIGTPKGYNEFYNIYKLATEDSEWFTVVLKASQSGLIDPKELADTRKTMSDHQYAQEFECSFSAPLLGAYYGDEIAKAEDEGRISRVPVTPSIQVTTAWDIGYGDSTAIWFAQVVGREVRIVDFYESSGAAIGHYAKVLKDKGYLYGKHILPHDADNGQLSTGKTIRQQLVEAGIQPCMVLARSDVDNGIQTARQFLGAAWIDAERCKRGIECLRNYQRRYDEKNKVYSQIPLHNWASHGADAFRYLAQGFPMINATVAKGDPFKISAGSGLA